MCIVNIIKYLQISSVRSAQKDLLRYERWCSVTRAVGTFIVCSVINNNHLGIQGESAIFDKCNQSRSNQFLDFE